MQFMNLYRKIFLKYFGIRDSAEKKKLIYIYSIAYPMPSKTSPRAKNMTQTVSTKVDIKAKQTTGRYIWKGQVNCELGRTLGLRITNSWFLRRVASGPNVDPRPPQNGRAKCHSHLPLGCASWPLISKYPSLPHSK